MKSYHVVIIGGGVSGCAALHYLHRKFSDFPEKSITLLEKNSKLGGAIATEESHGCLFETGPNGFLDSKLRTLEWIEELGLTAELMKADARAEVRYIRKGNQLFALPAKPQDFLKFPLLTIAQKFRVLSECIIPKGGYPEETIGQFGRRRLGDSFTKLFLDSMVSGVFAGNMDELVLCAAFPRIAELENEYHSLLKAQWYLAKKRKLSNSNGSPRGHLTSFGKGMQTVPQQIHRLYASQIQTECLIEHISAQDDSYCIKMRNSTIKAKNLIVATPAHVAARLTESVDEKLSAALRNIPYAPVAVVGLVYDANHCENTPTGFGYLIPSSEKSLVLGVLFEHHLFPQRMEPGKMMFRILIGGSRHPEINQESREAIVQLAQKELEKTLGIRTEPTHIFYKMWHKGIPQYNAACLKALDDAESHLKQLPSLTLLANYRHGISFNDCIENAWLTSEKITI